MKRKRVGCLQCKTAHFLDERVKPEHYSGGSWTSICPKCGCDNYVTVNKLNQYLREVRA